MRLSRLKFYAFTNPGLEKVLQTELNTIVGKSKIGNVFGKTGIELRADMSQMADIILKSRTITSLTVQVGRPIHASSLKLLQSNLEQLNWTSFFDFKNHKYVFPSPVARSSLSDIYQERQLRETFIKSVAEIFTFDEFERAAKEEPQKEQMTVDEKIKQLVGDKDSQLIQHSMITYKCPFYLSLYKNKLCVSLGVFDIERFKTGNRPFVGWGSVKENIVAAFLIGSGLKEKFINEKAIRIFDPFCGSGTFLIESLLTTAGFPVRKQMADQLDIWNWSFIKSFENELKEKFSQVNSLPSNLAVTLIGSDISKSQISNSVLNFRLLHSESVLDQFESVSDNQFDQLKEQATNSRIPYFSFSDKAILLNCDISRFPSLNDHLNDFVLITNIPFGGQSTKEETKETYSKFDLFLRDNHHRFSDVYVMNRSNVENENNYCYQSKFGWTPVMEFSNGGFAMAFFKFSVHKDHKKRETITITTERKRKGRSKRVIRTKIDVSKVNSVRPNSMKAKSALNIAKRRIYNQFLEQQKAYQVTKSKAIKEKTDSRTRRETKRVLGEVRAALGSESFDEFVGKKKD